MSIVTAYGSYVPSIQLHVVLHQGPPRAGLSEADAGRLEERALKMRKAMGENLADDVAGESPDARTRRLNLIKWAPLPCCPCWSNIHLSLINWAPSWCPRKSRICLNLMDCAPSCCSRWSNVFAWLPGGGEAALRQVAPSSHRDRLHSHTSSARQPQRMLDTSGCSVSRLSVPYVLMCRLGEK